MKYIGSVLLSILVLFPGIKPCFSQIDAGYEVATWYNFKDCAISYTFDDGCSGQFAKAIPIFDEFNYKLTLFVTGSWIIDWAKLKMASENGHEIANHTYTHQNMSDLDYEKQDEELVLCNKLINTNISDKHCTTMAYPYCVKGDEALHQKYFVAVRGCQGFVEGKTPVDFMNVSSVICGDRGQVKMAADFNNQANSAVDKNGWLVYLLHGVDNDGGYSPVASDELKKGLAYLKKNDDKFWVATFDEVARYIKERNCVSVNELNASEISVEIKISVSLYNNELYNYPISIQRELPKKWFNAEVRQNNILIESNIVDDNSRKSIRFNAIPNGGNVVITKKNMQ